MSVGDQFLFLGAKLSSIIGTSNVLESLEQWTRGKEIVVPMSPGGMMVRLDAPLLLETAADLFFGKLLSDENISIYFADLENYRFDQVTYDVKLAVIPTIIIVIPYSLSTVKYARLKCVLTTSYMRRLGARGMNLRDFSVLSNHLAAALREMQIPQTIICGTVAAMQPLKKSFKASRGTADDVL